MARHAAIWRQHRVVRVGSLRAGGASLPRVRSGTSAACQHCGVGVVRGGQRHVTRSDSAVRVMSEAEQE